MVSLFSLIFIILLGSSIYGYHKPLPAGTSFEGELRSGEVEFLFDLTYQKDGGIVREQVIFERMLSMINDAEDFIILDMFLFNDDYQRTVNYPSLSNDLADVLIEKKKQDPKMEIVFITDKINGFYGSYTPEPLLKLQQAGIELIYTDMTFMPDSNPAFSGLWRSTIQWFGNSEQGRLPNPFSPDSPDVTLRSYLEVLNFKANHRKVLITEKEALVTSGNPHDASAYHSNIAFVLKGKIIEDLLETEKAVAGFSGGNMDLFEELPGKTAAWARSNDPGYSVQVLTEGKIKQHLLKEIRETEATNTINMGVFYLSDRDIIKELIKASERNVEIRIILDANKDAFGREKNGVPNRPVAHELSEKSNNNIKIKWYNTNGEQFHTKLVMIEKEKEKILIGGSANLTKRNIADLNFETNVKVIGDSDLEIMRQTKAYFQRLWLNEGGVYTLDYPAYADESAAKQFMYRFQEWSGIASF
ncbi:MAG: phospholipase D family protein [Oscillospiraceae bacterium]|nr:phospholipase D family protein [Oscillospiraceae bacterium]